MRREVRLTPNQPTQVVDLTFDAVAISLSNPTGSPVYLRTGAPDIPSAENANQIFPAARSGTIATSGRTFALAIGDTALLTSGAVSRSGLFNVVVVTFLSAGEIVPTYGSESFQTLSLSEATNGSVPFTGAATSAVFDVGAWGGAIVTVMPVTGSGQGVVTVEVSATQTTWLTLGSWAFWPGLPIILTIPHTLRYMRLRTLISGIVGELALSGSYSVRFTLAELTQITYMPTGQSIGNGFVIASAAQFSWTFVTIGVPAISVGVNYSAGTRSEVILETSDLPAGPWRVVTYREQSVSGALSNSIYRSLGNLGPYTRVTLVDIATGGISGTLWLSMVVQPDLNAMLQNIFMALGDVQAGMPNTNQSIYHELDNVRQNTASTSTQVALVDARLSTANNTLAFQLTAQQNIQNNITAYLPNLSTIDADTSYLVTNHGVTGSAFVSQLLSAGTGQTIVTIGASRYVLRVIVSSGSNTSLTVRINGSTVAGVLVTANVPFTFEFGGQNFLGYPTGGGSGAVEVYTSAAGLVGGTCVYV